MMRQSLVPVMLLAVVALSSSNVLPLMPTEQVDSIVLNSQHNDNIFSNKDYNRDDLNTIFYTQPLRSQNYRALKKLTKYMNTNNDRTETVNEVSNEEDNYDDKGFRKEQWHNYPRQLDRLHDYLFNYRSGDIKRNIDTEDTGTEEYDASDPTKEIIPDIPTNGDSSDNDEDRNIYDHIVSATNPLLVLKVHLAYLDNKLKSLLYTKHEETIRRELDNLRDINDLQILYTDDTSSTVKVKREGAQENFESNENTIPKTVNKRLFSLWSRLQSLSHKGHELPHRRHLAYYGFPESEGNTALTAETRATLMRPPGSPLRWG